MQQKTPDQGLEAAQSRADGGDLEATIGENRAMQERLEQPANPDANRLAAEHSNLFKANGSYVEQTAFRTGSNGNTYGETRGATALAAAKDMKEVAAADASDMAEAERIMGEVAEMRENSQQDAVDTQNIDAGGIPESEPESGEVASLSAEYGTAEAQAGAEITTIEADTATAMNQALSGVRVPEEGPDALVQAG